MRTVFERMAAAGVVVLGLALGHGAGAPGLADEGSGGASGDDGAGRCPGGPKAYLAAGQWKGTFKIVYEPVVPGMPDGLKTSVTWAGQMGFAVHRPEKEDPPKPAPPPKPKRRQPLYPPLKEGEARPPPIDDDPTRAPPGKYKNDAEQIAAAEEYFRQQALREEEAAQARAERYGVEIPPSSGNVEKPEIEGGGKGKMTVTMNGMPMPDVRAAASGRTGEHTYKLKAVEQDADHPIKRIEVWGDRREVGVSYDITVSGRGGTGSSSGSTPSSSGENILVTYFEVEDLQCGVVSGHIDATAIREHTRKNLPGYDIRVSENTWTAKRDDRDESLEQKVAALVDQPIPARLSWGYLDEFTKQAGELRQAAKKDDYSRCILKALDGKLVRICRAFIKELGKAFPNAELQPSCNILREALYPLYAVQRVLEFYGGGDCPEVAQAWGNVGKQIQRRMEWYLKEKHTFQELSCFRALSYAGFMGDVDNAYHDALTVARVEAEALPK